MPTPHNQAQPGEIAKQVLMPGDPLRAKFIADTFLSNVRQVNAVRNVLAFTGEYKGKELTVMASGMGMPSIGIYSYELFTEYGVEEIIRIGSAGAYTGELKVYDVVLAESAYSESSFAKTQNGTSADILYPSRELNEKIKAAAKKLQKELHISRIHSSDVFYRTEGSVSYQEIAEKYGCSCVEMESFALFHNANVLGKRQPAF